MTRGSGDINPITLMEGLPDQESSFDLEKYENKKESNISRFDLQMKAFDQELFDQASGENPHRYGSYFIIEANNDTKTFKTATFINTTSQDAAAYFPQFLY